jgi:hypothetical protein
MFSLYKLLHTRIYTHVYTCMPVHIQTSYIHFFFLILLVLFFFFLLGAFSIDVRVLIYVFLWSSSSSFTFSLMYIFWFCSSQSDAKPVGGLGVTLAPIPACREDFSRMKLTAFDKLIERTCSIIRDVRLCSEPDQRQGAGIGNSSVAPDAA